MKRFFVSYSWKAEKETQVVDELQEACGSRSIELLRDSETVKYGGSIRSFMQDGTKAERVILILSEEYFQSRWCAYELFLTALRDNFSERIKPVLHNITLPFTDMQRREMVNSLLDFFRNDPQVFADEVRLQGITEERNFEGIVIETLKTALHIIADTPIPPLEDFRADRYSQIFGAPHRFGREPYRDDELLEALSDSLSSIDEKSFINALCQEINPVLTDYGLEKLDQGLVGKELYDGLANGLVRAMREGSDDCTVITRVLSGASALCLDDKEEDLRFRFVKDQARRKVIKGIENLLGIVLMTAVTESTGSGRLLDADLSGLHYEVNLRHSGSIEVFLSKQQHRVPDLQLRSDNVVVEGKYLIFPNIEKFAWNDAEKLKELQNQIWAAAISDAQKFGGSKTGSEDRSPTFLSEDEIKLLKAKIQIARTAKQQRHFAVVLEISSMSSEAVKECKKFLKKLEIPVVRYRTNSDDRHFIHQESNLLMAATTLLQELETYR